MIAYDQQDRRRLGTAELSQLTKPIPHVFLRVSRVALRELLLGFARHVVKDYLTCLCLAAVKIAHGFQDCVGIPLSIN